MDMMHFNHHCMSPGPLEAKLAGSTSGGRTRWRRRARSGVGPKGKYVPKGEEIPVVEPPAKKFKVGDGAAGLHP